jgi:hypothetical protein
MLALCRSPTSTFNGTFNRLPPFFRLTHAYKYENPTLSNFEAGPLVLPHAALALLVVNLPDSRMKRQAASMLV